MPSQARDERAKGKATDGTTHEEGEEDEDYHDEEKGGEVEDVSKGRGGGPRTRRLKEHEKENPTRKNSQQRRSQTVDASTGENNAPALATGGGKLLVKLLGKSTDASTSVGSGREMGPMGVGVSRESDVAAANAVSNKMFNELDFREHDTGGVHVETGKLLPISSPLPHHPTSIMAPPLFPSVHHSHLVLDVETDGYGGFRPPRQRIMQFAYIRVPRDDGNGVVGESASHYIRGVSSVHPTAAAKHGITPQMCNDRGVDFDVAFREFMQELDSCDALAAHNADFHVGCLRHELRARGMHAELERLELRLASVRVVCTMRAGTEVCRLPQTSARYTGYKRPTLAELHRELLGREPDGPLNDALVDCRTVLACLRPLALRTFVPL
eukprot:CAMPEP_0177767746 /NCGR_PEP_ID=MMETSP0491_2-20121128/9309_1 /TAXON_ID=63592 /ORGANISM="Tetraselmis chuii, Strain PLY429" /LENGTH=382 /DNA_ID=CAMNT_0019284421 /DNA_START=801 /DNA_END=1949 /DNA_ORIENTATION=-